MHFFTASFMTVLVIAIHVQTSNALPVPEADANLATEIDPDQWLQKVALRESRVPSDEEIQEMAKSIDGDGGISRAIDKIHGPDFLREDSPHEALDRLVAEDQATSSRGYRGAVSLDNDPEPAANAAPGGGSEGTGDIALTGH